MSETTLKGIEDMNCLSSIVISNVETVDEKKTVENLPQTDSVSSDGDDEFKENSSEEDEDELSNDDHVYEESESENTSDVNDDDEDSSDKKDDLEDEDTGDKKEINESKSINMIRFRCSVCPFTTKTRFSLSRHQATHEEPKQQQPAKSEIKQEEATEFRCRFCPFSSKIRFALERHLLAHKISYDKLPKNVLFKNNQRKAKKVSYNEAATVIIERPTKMKPNNDNNGKGFACTLCSYITNNKFLLTKHLQNHSIHKKPIVKCDYCDFASFTYIVDKHRNSIHGRRRLTKSINQCTFCSYATPIKDYMITHIQKHTASKEPIIKCTKCDFASFQLLVTIHMTKQHNARKLIKCSYCSYSTPIIALHRIHARKHTVYKIPVVKCTKCDFASFKNILSRHMHQNHATEAVIANTNGAKRLRNEPLKKCKFCEYKSTSFYVDKDINVMHSLNRSCSQCSYSTTNPNTFYSHQRRHKENTPLLKCRMCEFKSFDYIVKIHTDTVHKKRKEAPKPIIKEKPKASKRCKPKASERYQSKTSEQYRCKPTKMKPNNDNNGKGFACTLCSYTANQKKTLQLHLQSHRINKKPIVKCDYCDFASFSYIVTRHMTIIHGTQRDGFTLINNIKQCSFCSYSTPSKALMITHIQKHTASKEPIIKCTKCDFASFQLLVTIHMTKQHNIASAMKLIKCLYCSYSTARIDLHKIHVRNHTVYKIPVVKCTKCDFASFKEVLIRHMLQNHATEAVIANRFLNQNKDETVPKLPKVEHLFVCEMCEFVTLDKQKLLEHKLTHNQQSKVVDKEEIKCIICQRHFRFVDLAKHVCQVDNEMYFVNVVDGKRVTYKCRVCPMESNFKAILIQHYFTMHTKDSSMAENLTQKPTKASGPYQSKTSEQYLCKLCPFTANKSTSLAGQFLNQIKVETLPKLPKIEHLFVCEMCELVTPDKQKLLEHKLTHNQQPKVVDTDEVKININKMSVYKNKSCRKRGLSDSEEVKIKKVRRQF